MKDYVKAGLMADRVARDFDSPDPHGWIMADDWVDNFIIKTHNMLTYYTLTRPNGEVRPLRLNVRSSHGFVIAMLQQFPAEMEALRRLNEREVAAVLKVCDPSSEAYGQLLALRTYRRICQQSKPAAGRSPAQPKEKSS